MLEISLRKASLEDSLDLFNWRNDSLTRHMSRNSTLISQSEHDSWYEKAISDANKIFLIGEKNNNKLGVVRFDYVNHKSAEINININPELRGRGYGQILLREACNYVLSNLSIKRIYAEIKTTNVASVKIFEKAGFKYLPQKEKDLLRMKLTK